MTPNPERRRRAGGLGRRRRPGPGVGAGAPRHDGGGGGTLPVEEVAIEAVGARGDGVGRLGADPVYVPLALPGDRLRVRLEGRRGDGWAARELAALVRAPRAEPACGHFGDCGGCALQHLPPPDYVAWKRQRVVDALARRGLDAGAVVAAPRVAPPASRRRARLRFDGRRTGGASARGAGVRLGFRARASHRTVDVLACPVLVPAITALLPPLRRVLSGLDLAAEGGEVLVTATDGGLDVLLTAPDEPTLADRERLAAFAAAEDLARLSWRPAAGAAAEPIAARRPAALSFDGLPVEPPPGAFLQATAFGEAVLREELLRALGAGGVARFADLFAGCGALGLPAVRSMPGASLEAFEADGLAVDALLRAARAAGLGDRVGAAARDLEREPLRPEELARFDAVVLDPPRAGARAQSTALAASPAAAVPLVVMASCDPATFARDARLLVDGGYGLERVVPIDQFLWSGQVELVAILRRPAGDRGRARANAP